MSRKMTSGKALTTGRAASLTTASPLVEPEVLLEFKLEQEFEDDLKNTSSSKFKELENQLTVQLDMIYTQQYGESFNRTEIKGFRQGSVIVDAVLVFNNRNAVPETSNIAQTLVAAVSSNSSVLNLPINTTSIVITRTLQTITKAPTTAVTTPARSTILSTATKVQPTVTSNPAALTAVSVKPTVARTTTPTGVTVAPTVPNTAVPTGPPSNEEGTLELQFRLNQQFTQELSNQNSQQFKDLAKNITKEVNTVYKTSFPSTYSRSRVNRFWNGSVGVDMTLIFKNQLAVPSTSSVEDALNEALSSGQIALSIISGSIIARETTETTTPAAPTTSTSGPSALRKAHLASLSLSLVFTYLAQTLIL
ncbi:hypothetical protein AAFF_G00376030 [Aldrovandia affinis]|uniref:SEA domain-containing protein n=1 Tax=Aldrovandia affinis TaxID=143900 RepID=A0AAD7VZG3_9TELE|nr:hypothetical protein AAFF_G00376030 [Aldrovandia affinis]